MSINTEQSHLAKPGSCAHDMVGPISIPSVGPTLLNALSVIVMALVLSIPAAIMEKAHNRHITNVTVRKANSVTRFCVETFTPPIFNGKMALGCNNCLNSLRITLSNITPRMHLKPPLVLPEQAPMNMQKASITHVTCGQRAASSLKSPVVVMNETTWNMATRKAFSNSYWLRMMSSIMMKAVKTSTIHR